MSKVETLRQSAAATNEMRLERLTSQIETVRQAKHQSAEDLALTLEPLAQAMAALADETRQTLAEINRQCREQGDQFSSQVNAAAKNWKEAAISAQKAADHLNESGTRMEWKHYGLTIITGALTAVLVSAFWLWLAPPTVQNRLDARAVANYLKPAVIEALRRSRDK
jgi:uncharacterized phage infection (PIP) family protein YhgE